MITGLGGGCWDNGEVISLHTCIAPQKKAITLIKDQSTMFSALCPPIPDYRNRQTWPKNPNSAKALHWYQKPNPKKFKMIWSCLLRIRPTGDETPRIRARSRQVMSLFGVQRQADSTRLWDSPRFTHQNHYCKSFVSGFVYNDFNSWIQLP